MQGASPKGSSGKGSPADGSPQGISSGDDSSGDVSRREFLKIAGLGAAGLLLPGGEARAADAPGEERRITPEELEKWQAGLLTSEARIYRSDVHTEARMHLGGIGTGNVELGADGQFTTWNMFNTLSDGYVPLYFGLKAGDQVRLLQTSGGPAGLPRVSQITMRGEYPIAELEFHDPAIPIQARLTAMTPLVPLDTAASSMPAIHLQFELKNDSDHPVPVSLAGFMLNPIGYEGKGSFVGACHPLVGNNYNHFERDKDLALLQLTARAGHAPDLEQPVTIYTNPSGTAFARRSHSLPHGLEFLDLAQLPAPDQTPAKKRSPGSRRERPVNSPAAGSEDHPVSDLDHTVIWLESPDVGMDAGTLKRIMAAVEHGATLLITGAHPSLLEAYGLWSGGHTPPADTGAAAVARTDVVIEDFESGTYKGWTVEGTAFGAGPARGTAPNQQPVSGFQGHYLVNSYQGSDEPQGRLLSAPFWIQRKLIRFLIGGGSSPETAIRLLVDGKIVRSRSGRDSEQLEPAAWNVEDLQGQEARLEIIDHASGGWGHINIDDIVQSDSTGNAEVMALLGKLLPANFRSLHYQPGEITLDLSKARGIPGSLPPTLWLPGYAMLEEFSLREGSVDALDQEGGSLPTPMLLARSVGDGLCVLLAAPLIPSDAGPGSMARASAVAFLASMGGVQAPLPNGPLPDAPGYGEFVLAARGGTTTAALASLDFPSIWDEFTQHGRLGTPRTGSRSRTTLPGCSIFGALCAENVVPAHGSLPVVFILSWRLPNLYSADGETKDQNVGNYYATLWPDAGAVARELAADPHNIVGRTLAFRQTMYDSTLPYWLLDCFTSQLGTVRHIGVVFRPGAGDVYGWEGSNGCCQPTCTHVWGYEQSLSRVFPDLERRMRFIDFKHQQQPDGGIRNRTDWPSPPHPTGEQPFADGHASCILKAYREALNTPDDAWLREYWPNISKAVEYLIARDSTPGAAQQTDAKGSAEPDGILEDAQFNTYDDAIHGPNSFIGSYYLAALRAGEEMALRVGDGPRAARYRQIYERGVKNLVALCWNGDYYQQKLPDYAARSGEYGPGCLSDQLIGQWWAHLMGLGALLPQDQVRTALRSIFTHNWLSDMSGWRHNQRWFAGGHDKGLLICTWPKGGRPDRPIPYVDEVWTGVEYEVAALMIYEGMITEGLSIAKGARDRYDGVPRPPMRRNPWNELECGGHYARAMSSWGLLIALSGFHYDGPNRRLKFAPRVTPGQFRAFFTAPQAWGSASQRRDGTGQVTEFRIVEGILPLQSLELQPPAAYTRVEVNVDGAVIPPRIERPAAPASGESAIVLWLPPGAAASRSVTVRFT